MKCLPVQILLQIYILIFGHIWERLDICDRSNIKMLIKARWNTLGKLHSNTLKTFCSDVRGQLTNITVVQMHSNTLKYTQILSSTLKYSQVHSTTLKYTQILSSTLKYSQVHSNTPKYTQILSKLLPLTLLLGNGKFNYKTQSKGSHQVKKTEFCE